MAWGLGYRWGGDPERDFDDPAVNNVRGGGLLDRFASRLPDYGYGGGQDAKRAALQRAMTAMGMRMLAGAGKEGVGAIAPAMSEGFGAYQGGLEDLHQQRRQEEADELVQEQYQRQRDLSDAQIENFKADNERAASEAQAKVRARAEYVAGQRAALEKLTPEQRARMEAHVGSDKFDERLWEVTAPEKKEKPDRREVGGDLIEIGADGKPRVLYRAPKEPKAPGEPTVPTTREFADGTTRQYDPGSGEWRILAAEKPKASADEIRKHAHDMYQDAIRDQSGAVYSTKEDGTPDLKATWNKALAAAQVAAPPAAPAPASGGAGAPRPPQQKLADIETVLKRQLPPAVRKAVLEDLARGMAPRDIVAELRKDLR